ncbi:MAG: HD domain-containing protein [Nitrospirae bacterium]|nr:HD domain-containing protein [Nitrospirota bacterium]
MVELFSHDDRLDALNRGLTLSEKLKTIHGVLRARQAFVDRIAVAVYDAKTDTLKTFIDSSGDARPLVRYEAKLADTGSLRHMLDVGRPRVINDLTRLEPGQKEHSRRIQQEGYASSYTMPMHRNGMLWGFLFFDSYRKAAFQPGVLDEIDLAGHLIIQVVVGSLMAFRAMLATVKATRDITAYRDLETGAHLDRMSHYARLIARRIAPQYGLDDEYIEHIFLFSPLHDIGKIGVSDVILRKPGRLSPDEFEEMKRHTTMGRQIVDNMLRDFGLEVGGHVDMMRHIAELHHEAIGGGGYPKGLAGDQIPIEARIVAVADIFDALTSVRPYKAAWTNEEAFGVLRELGGNTLDAGCIEALCDQREEIGRIQAKFRDPAPA